MLGEPSTRTGRGLPLADLVSASLLVVVGLLHVRRAIACRQEEPPKASLNKLWDWRCTADSFASWSFLPLHALAAAALAGWVLLSVRGSLGWMWRSLAGETPQPREKNDLTLRQIECFLAAWAGCWFAPASPFAASADCADQDAACPNWATGGECEKNAAFMLKTCRASCGACVRAAAAGGWGSLGPRVVTLVAAGSLFSLAVARIGMAFLSERSQARLAFCARAAARPLQVAASLCMRTPIGPLLLALLRLLRAALVSVGMLLRLVGGLLDASWDGCRRRMVRLLGGEVVDLGDFNKDF